MNALLDVPQRTMARNFATEESLTGARPYGGWQMILADFPWRQEMRSEKGEGKSPQAKYDCMTLEDCKLFGRRIVRQIAARDSTCLMWTTSPLIKASIEVLEDCGFIYKSMATWAKESKNSGDLDTEDDDHKWTFGTGYIFRSAAEFILCGTRGDPAWKTGPGSRSVRNLIYAPTREHSRKPDQQYEIAETLMPGPYLELFSRTSRPGWDHFGNQVGQWEG
jgi:N6-adenosine-specific RNA methylase IME4